MIKRLVTLDVQDPWPEDVNKELRQIWEDARNSGGGSNGSYVEFSDEMWDDYEYIPKALRKAGYGEYFTVLILIRW